MTCTRESRTIPARDLPPQTRALADRSVQSRKLADRLAMGPQLAIEAPNRLKNQRP